MKASQSLQAGNSSMLLVPVLFRLLLERVIAVSSIVGVLMAEKTHVLWMLVCFLSTMHRRPQRIEITIHETA